MATIRVMRFDGKALGFPEPDGFGVSVALKPSEVAALVDAGVWRASKDPEAWTATNDKGEVYAGRGMLVPGTPYAKIRGKNGHRLGAGRWTNESLGLEKREPSSFGLFPSARDALKRLADEHGISDSRVVEIFALHGEFPGVPADPAEPAPTT